MNQAEKIEKAIEELFSREKDYGEACKDYAEKEHCYRMAKATAYLSASGTIDERKAKADKECSAQMKAKLTAEAVMNMTKAKLEDVRQVMSARQSILSAEAKVHYATKNYTA